MSFIQVWMVIGVGSDVAILLFMFFHCSFHLFFIILSLMLFILFPTLLFASTYPQLDYPLRQSLTPSHTKL